LVGETRDELGGSEYYDYLDEVGANVPKVKPEETRRHYEAVHSCHYGKLAGFSHGIYRGGLAVALAETAIAGGRGIRIDLDKVPLGDELKEDKILYSETPSRFLLTLPPENSDRFQELASGVNAERIGSVEGNSLVVEDLAGDELLNLSLDKLKEKYYGTFEEY